MIAEMTDDEYELLDELYFTASLAQLLDTLAWERNRVVSTLQSLAEKGWLKCVSLHDGQDLPDSVSIPTQPEAYHYLATKAGLFAHNRR